MDFILGSELEICIRTRFLTDGKFEYINNHSWQAKNLLTKMRNHGFDTHDIGYNGSDKYNKWCIHGDASINAPEHYKGLELVSPCLPASDYFCELAKMLNWIGEEIVTNSSTGFHHGLSIANKEQMKVFKHRALLFMYEWGSKYEQEEIVKWNRQNEYCRPIMPSIAAELRTYLGPLSRFEIKATEVRDEHLTNTVYNIGQIPRNLQKYFTMNCAKLCNTETHTPYVECRVMGNTDYFYNINKVHSTLKNVMNCMERIVDDKEAQQIFVNFIQYAKNHNGKISLNPKLISKLERQILG